MISLNTTTLSARVESEAVANKARHRMSPVAGDENASFIMEKM
jgi:hypothetical protein